MRASSHKDLSVYDFDAEDEAVEALAGKLISRFDSNRPAEAVDSCLQAFNRLDVMKRTVTGVSSMDLPERENTHVSCAVEVSEGNLALIAEKSESIEIAAISPNYHEDSDLCQNEFELETIAREEPADSLGMQIDVNSDNEESSSSYFGSLSSGSGILENEGLSNSPYIDCTMSQETYDNETEIVVSPDYVLYGNRLFGESQLTFFSDFIRIECSEYSNSSKNDGKFMFETAIADVIHIDSQWSRSAEVAVVELFLKNTALFETERAHDSSDILKVMFSFTGIQWLDKEKKIKSLAVRYKDIWNTFSNDDVVLEDDNVDPDMFLPKHCFTEITDPFEDVIYPKGDPDAVSISKRDIELLQPDTFINDTIIDFYIKYLKNKIEPCERNRLHFFNSFFFRKLADLDKDPANALGGKAAFQRVRKWTRKVNIFEKDYIFIPVNYNLHWSLLVICHPGHIASMGDVEIKESPKISCILHMDSIKGSHTGLRTLIQSYLCEEWKERHPDSTEDCLLRFSNLRFVPLELPQQENLFDCGLFLLHYVELFLEEAPTNFSPFRITKFSCFLTEDWFLPAEASHKRSLIRKLIYDLLNNPDQIVTPAIQCNETQSAGHIDQNHQHESIVDSLPENCAAETVDSVCSVAEIRIKMLTTYSSGVSEGDKHYAVLQDFLEPKDIVESATEDKNHPLQSTLLLQKLDYTRCPTEEYGATPDQFDSSSPKEDAHKRLDADPPLQICSPSYSTKDAGEFGSWFAMQEEKVGMDSDNVLTDYKNETEKQFSTENHRYIADSPSTSYDMKLGSSLEDSPEIGIIKGACEDPKVCQEVDTTEVVYDVESCEEINTKAETECCQNQSINQGKAEEADDENCKNINVSKAEEAKGKDGHCINTSKSEGLEGKNHVEVDDTKAHGVNTEDVQAINTNEEGSDRHQEIGPLDADFGVGSVPPESFQDILSSVDEEADAVNCKITIVSTTEEDKGKDCHCTSTTESVGVKGKDYEEADTTKAHGVNSEDGQAIDTNIEGFGSHHEIDTVDADVGAGSVPCSESLPPESSQDLVSSDDEPSLNSNDARQKRDKPGARLEQQQLKRRKLMLPEGSKRHTRRCSRN